MKRTTKAFLVIAMALTTLCAFGTACQGQKPYVPIDETVKIENFAISTDGVITFDSQTGKTYYLAAGDNRLTEVKSGDDVTALITETKTEYSVVGENAASDSVTAYKPAGVTDLSLNGTNIVFTAVSTEQKLYLGEKTEQIVTSGADISEKLATGANSVYLYTEGKVEEDAVMIGSKSNEISVYVHDKPTFSVTADGKISFTEINGFTYSLTIGSDVDALTVTDGSDLTEKLDALAAGDNTFTLSVTGSENGSNYFIVPSANAKAESSLKKYAEPSNIAVSAENNITFTADTQSVQIYVGDEYKGTVESGDNIYKYFIGKTNVLKLVSPSDDNGWRSVASQNVEVKLDKFLSATFTDEKGAEVYSNEKGVVVKGQNGTVIEYSEEISLKNVATLGTEIIRISANDFVDAKGFERLVIKFIDVYDDTKGLAFYMVNGTKIGFGDGSYYCSGPLSTDYAQKDPGEFTPQTNPVATMSNSAFDLRIKFTDYTKYEIGVLHDDTECGQGLWYGGIKNYVENTDEVFSAENVNELVKIRIEFIKTESPSGFCVETIGGESSGTDKFIFDTSLITATETATGYEVQASATSKMTYNTRINLNEFWTSTDTQESADYLIKLKNLEPLVTTKVTIRFTDVNDASKGVAIVFINASGQGYGWGATAVTYMRAGNVSDEFPDSELDSWGYVSSDAGRFGSSTASVAGIKFDTVNNKFYFVFNDGTNDNYVAVTDMSKMDASKIGSGTVKVSIEFDFSPAKVNIVEIGNNAFTA